MDEATISRLDEWAKNFQANFKPHQASRRSNVFYNTLSLRDCTGYTTWGFVIFGGAYGDDILWEKVITMLEMDARYWLQKDNLEEVLWPSLTFTVIDDRAALNGVTKDAVRAKFRQWAARRCVERDGKGADSPLNVRQCPRFRYCVYVDQDCLDSMREFWNWMTYSWQLRGQIILIDGTHGHHEDDYSDMTPGFATVSGSMAHPRFRIGPGGQPPIEGNTAVDVGWRYARISRFTCAYEDLHKKFGSHWETWNGFYQGMRPLEVGRDEGSHTEPLSQVDLSRTARF